MKTNLLISVFLLFVMLPVAKSQWTYTNLSEPKYHMGAATLGNKAYFAGGYDKTTFMDLVEVYDVSTDTWDIAGSLFIARQIIGGSASCGSKIFFAGGYDENISYDIVDIYDTLTKEWSVGHLSEDRFSLSAVSHGKTVLFAGGVQFHLNSGPVFKNTVDIYNTETGVWTVDHLSKSRMGLAATVVGDLAFFAGGMDSTFNTTDRVDIYNFTTKTWSQATLSQARAYASAVTVGTKVIIAGGTTSIDYPTSRVDIYDIATGLWTTAKLSSRRAAEENAAVVSGKAYFVGGGNFMGSGFNYPSKVIDIYDPVLNKWTVESLSQPLESHAVVGVGNHLVVAGGQTLGELCVKKVEIFTPPTLINVPADYPKIQLAIDAASDGDTVLVAENTYYENINFKGKAIVVGSKFIKDGDTSHISKTIINGSQPVNPEIGSVVTFNSGEDTTSVLCGFTITGGTGSNETIESSVWRIGGGIRILASGAKLLNNYIEGNTVSNTGGVLGGGILAGGSVTDIPWVVIRNNRIMNNRVLSSGDQGTGGGVAIYYNVIMADNEIIHNEANGPSHGGAGGAAFLEVFGPIQLNIRNNMITDNKAVSVSNSSRNTIGGGMVIAFKCSGIVSGNTISNNTLEPAIGTWGEGSGVVVQEVVADDFIFENNFITNNTYVSESCIGGGMIIFKSGGKFQNNVIKENQATRGGGIAITNNPGEPAVLINNTITGNAATTYGGGLDLEDAKAVVVNTLIWGNTAQSGYSVYMDGSNTLDVRYSDVQGNNVWPGEGNMNEDPKFEADGYHLTYLSPLLNKGKSSVLVNGITYSSPLFDIDRDTDARPFKNTEPEIGADELQTDVSVSEPVSANGLSIILYPNPANRLVKISVKNMAVIDEVEVYNQTGQIVLKVKPVNNTFDISNLQPGVYYCRLKADRQVITKKIIKY